MDYSDLKIEDLERYLKDIEKSETKNRQRDFLLYTGERGYKKINDLLFLEMLKPFVKIIYPNLLKTRTSNKVHANRILINEELSLYYNITLIDLFNIIALFLDEIQYKIYERNR